MGLHKTIGYVPFIKNVCNVNQLFKVAPQIKFQKIEVLTNIQAMKLVSISNRVYELLASFPAPSSPPGFGARNFLSRFVKVFINHRKEYKLHILLEIYSYRNMSIILEDIFSIKPILIIQMK